MGLSICSLASGSGGNCILLSSPATNIILDVGLNLKRLESFSHSLANPDSFFARQGGIDSGDTFLLVTHQHGDHVRYLSTVAAKHSLTAFVHQRTVPFIPSHRLPRLNPFELRDFYIGDITVSPFKVSHDVHCVGFSFYHQGHKLTVMTDLGVITDDIIEHASGSSVLFIEANHDLDLLAANNRYDARLKSRIASNKGHLSNSDCALAVAKMIRLGTKHVMLCHLSEENNYPELAFSTVCSTLSQNGISEGRDCTLNVAPTLGISKILTTF